MANQRRAEKIQRLVQLYSAQDLTGLSEMERAAQRQEMMSVYRAFDEGWLDKALAAAESGEEQTPPMPTGNEGIILQARRALGHAKSTSNDESRPVQRPSTEEPAARTKASPAVTQLRNITARAARRLQAIHEYLEWLPDDDQARPEPHADEHTGGAGEAWWRTPLDQLWNRRARMA
jgi:DNA-binding NtrC family response regulator